MRSGEDSEIKTSARLVDRNTVDDHLVVSGLSATHKQRSKSAALTSIGDDRAGGEAQSLSRRHRLKRVQFGRIDDRDVAAGFRAGRRSRRRRDRYRLLGSGQLQMQGQRGRLLKRDLLRLRGETGRKHLYTVVSRLQVVEFGNSIGSGRADGNRRGLLLAVQRYPGRANQSGMGIDNLDLDFGSGNLKNQSGAN